MIRPRLLSATILMCAGSLAVAQSSYQLDPQNTWKRTDTAAADPDRAAMSQVRTMLAEGRFDDALKAVNVWIDANESSDNPVMADALLLRGNAKLGLDCEYDALIDYEKVVKRFPESPIFVTALERELDVASLYLHGLLKRSLGIRIDTAYDLSEEIIVRINERLPGSRLAEKGLIELADFYYRQRDLKMAATAYDCFVILFPRSELRQKAMERRIYATIAQFKGPRYDASGLIEGGFLVAQYQAEYPREAAASGVSDALAARLDESAAAQKMSIAKWYIKHDDLPAARLTLQRLVNKHPATGTAHEAITMLQERGWLAAPEAPATPPAAPAPAATTTEQPK